MKDYLGQELKINDYVIGIDFFAVATCFFVGKIEDFTETRAVIKILKNQDMNWIGQISKIVPDKIVKIYNYKEK